MTYCTGCGYTEYAHGTIDCNNETIIRLGEADMDKNMIKGNLSFVLMIEVNLDPGIKKRFFIALVKECTGIPLIANQPLTDNYDLYVKIVSDSDIQTTESGATNLASKGKGILKKSGKKDVECHFFVFKVTKINKKSK